MNTKEFIKEQKENREELEQGMAFTIPEPKPEFIHGVEKDGIKFTAKRQLVTFLNERHLEYDNRYLALEEGQYEKILKQLGEDVKNG